MLKGALVELTSGLQSGPPNVIIFQFNPETLRHAWSQPTVPTTGTTGTAGAGSALAVAGAPTESFSFSLAMDVTDQLADPDPVVRQMAEKLGIYPRLAALELLLYPSGSQARPTGGTAAPGSTPSAGADRRPTPAAILPTVLFVWGTDRVLPVRVTSLTITEKLYNAALSPTHAEAQIELKVLTPEDLRSVKGELGSLALAAYAYSQGLRISRAVATVGESQRQVIGILTDSLKP